MTTEKLYPFQKQGVEWIREDNGILCDEPGLGKTVQALVGMNEHRKIIVLCPKTAIETWVNETKKWTDREIYVLWKNHDKWIKTPRKAVWILNYEQVHTFIYKKYADIFYSGKKIYPPLKDVSGIILDEMHRLRNHMTYLSSNVGYFLVLIWQSNKNRPHIVGLTATPLTNRPEELVQLKIFTYQYKKPRVLRREKRDVAKELPAVIEEEQFVRLNKIQRKCYNEVLKQSGSAFGKITNLKKICISANLYNEKYRVDSEKFLRAYEIIEEEIMNNNKVLVFSEWIKPLLLFRDRYLWGNFTSELITGKTPLGERKRIQERFKNKKDPQVLLLTIGTGGESLNLQTANVVIFLDLWWTYASIYQALNRVHRLGQTKPVRVVRIISKNTIEEKINERIKRKEKFTKEFLKEVLR